jgi:hypothetical protein
MSYLLWLPAIAVVYAAVKYFRHPRKTSDDHGTVSAQWLHERRRETQPND